MPFQKRGRQESRNVAYLRVSTIDQDLKKNKADVLTLANDKGFGKVEFVEEKASGKKSWKERVLKSLIEELGEGDRLIVPELSRLGRSMLEIMEILADLNREDTMREVLQAKSTPERMP